MLYNRPGCRSSMVRGKTENRLNGITDKDDVLPDCVGHGLEGVAGWRPEKRLPNLVDSLRNSDIFCF